ncbi:hypothetical protein [uncultured Amnibacterium sp.]|uniref:hypothetical protein n=1 Tax=uncultured Amnibacterium sp. TaxID=1631851 RepID=UPI0035CBEE91
MVGDPFDAQLPPVGDAEVESLLATSRDYTMVVLRAGPNRQAPEASELVQQHGVRTLRLRKGGWLRVVARVADTSPLAGVCVFDLDLEQTRRLMASDPAVRAGVLLFEAHRVHAFPGDGLPSAG